MAHDGFLGGFHGLAWPFAHAAVPAGLDALQLGQVVMGSGGGREERGALGTLAVDVNSALSSLVSSPTSLAAAMGGCHEAVLMDELASRLGGVCGDLSVPSPSSSLYASCYSTPASSPSKPAQAVVPVLAADSLLADRSARMQGLTPSGGLGGGKLSRVASSQSLLAEPAPVALAAVPPCSGHLPGSDGSISDGHSRKRKASGSKARSKDALTTAMAKSLEPETRSTKCKLSMTAARNDGPINPAVGDGKGKDAAAEPPKDYIHVRARRGQATDSHSLAERVRREKISERMKLLQDLVPGCSKVTGKAVMLDEIINYVQSLQRQVEFLSMKLATVNPRLDFDVDSLIPEDAVPAPANPPAPPPMPLPLPPPPASYGMEASSSAFCYASSHSSQGTAMQQSAVTNAEMLPSFIPGSASIDGFQSAISQVVSLWEEDDLQSVVQMGFRGNT